MFDIVVIFQKPKNSNIFAADLVTINEGLLEHKNPLFDIDSVRSGIVTWQCGGSFLLERYVVRDIVSFWPNVIQMVQNFLVDKVGTINFFDNDSFLSIEYVDETHLKVCVSVGVPVEHVVPLKEFLVGIVSHAYRYFLILHAYIKNPVLQEHLAALDSIRNVIISAPVDDWWQWVIRTSIETRLSNKRTQRLACIRDIDGVLRHVCRQDIRGYIYMEYQQYVLVKHKERLDLIEEWRSIMQELMHCISAKSKTVIARQMSIVWHGDNELIITTRDEFSLVVKAKDFFDVMYKEAKDFFETMDFLATASNYYETDMQCIDLLERMILQEWSGR